MDEKRMGEIALAVLRDRIRREPVHLGPNYKRELGNAAKRLNISQDEMKLFARTLIEEAIEETLG
jgi:hypothetical protein